MKQILFQDKLGSKVINRYLVIDNTERKISLGHTLRLFDKC